MKHPSSVIELVGASFSHGGAAQLVGVSATIERGDAVALVGPNGSGKSTLLGGLVGQVALVAGEVRVLGRSPREARDSIGYLPQTMGVAADFPLTLRQVVMMGRYQALGWWRWPGRLDAQCVDAALDRVGLLAQARTPFGELSGGQQQRGILARALTSQPRVLLLDEPFNGLDRPNRQELLRTLQELRAEGVTIVTSTHDLELARAVCTRVMLLNRRLVAFGPVAETLRLSFVEQTFEGSLVHVDDHTVVSAVHEHD